MKTFNSKWIIPVVGLLFITNTGHAQFSGQSNQTATALVNYLTGLNVTVTNATLSCPSGESGTFTYGGSILGMTDGVVLSTAPLSAIGDPVGNFAPAGSTGGGDTTLSNNIPGTPSTYDACILECDVVADYDTLYLNYSFASEEYPEYACSQFNDAFGFFIQGPGFPAYTNFALVPGTNIPTAINSVNIAPNGTFFPLTNCTNMGTGSPFSQYYVDNQGLAGQDIVFDGLTSVIEAFIVVTTNVSYHLKFVVANVSDGTFQSGVFMEGGSLASKGASTTKVANLSGNIPGLKVYPNPFTEEMAINIPNELTGRNVEVNVTDVVGKTVYSYSGNANSLNKELAKQSQRFVPGMYSLSLVSENLHQVIKFQKN